MINALESTSTRPYLIRALYEWCTDNGFTPYVAVSVDETVAVPREYVRNGEIVLNISFDATSALKLGNDAIEFKARFAGIAREIMVPINRVMAVYARENGQGMAFPMGAPGATGTLGDNVVGKETLRDVVKAPTLSSVPDAGRDTDSNGNIVPLMPAAAQGDGDQSVPPRPSGGGRPSLKRVK